MLTDNELRFPGWDSVREWNAKCGVLCCKRHAFGTQKAWFQPLKQLILALKTSGFVLVLGCECKRMLTKRYSGLSVFNIRYVLFFYFGKISCQDILLHRGFVAELYVV